MDITGRKLFVKALEEEGVDTIFGYPGGTVTDLFDELYKNDNIDLVLPRHEQGLIHEAEGYAKSTGKVGVCLVTSGPGATNIITGLADAHYDSIPLVCFTGQVPLSLIGNDAFQEVDIVGITRSITKYGVTVRDRKELGKIIKMAFHIAQTGKPGPVLVDIPKDIQTATGSSDYPDHVDIRGYKINESVHIGQLKKAYKLLKSAQRPLILAGGGINISRANKELLEFATKMNVPVVTTVMGRGAVPTTADIYVGSSGLHGKYAANLAVSECDVLFSIGTRFNDRITGDLNEFAPKAKIVHIDIDTSSISRNVVVGSVFEDDDNSTVCVIHAYRIYQEDNRVFYNELDKGFKSIVEKEKHNDEYNKFIENNAPSLNEFLESISYDFELSHSKHTSDSGLEPNRHVFQRNYKIKLPYGITIKQLEVFENEW